MVFSLVVGLGSVALVVAFVVHIVRLSPDA